MHVHTRWTATEVLQKKKKNNYQGTVKARGRVENCCDAARFGESCAYPGGCGGYLYFNQIHSRNIIKHSETQIT